MEEGLFQHIHYDTPGKIKYSHFSKVTAEDLKDLATTVFGKTRRSSYTYTRTKHNCEVNIFYSDITKSIRVISRWGTYNLGDLKTDLFDIPTMILIVDGVPLSEPDKKKFLRKMGII